MQMMICITLMLQQKYFPQIPNIYHVTHNKLNFWPISPEFLFELDKKLSA